MTEARIFRLTGYYMKTKKKIPLSFECRALSEDHALEKAFSELGSRHRVKRNLIFIDKESGIEEISLEEAKEPEFQDMEEEDFVIYK